MIFGGGCGGGGNGPTPDPAGDGHVLKYDSDKDGIADVFEDYIISGGASYMKVMPFQKAEESKIGSYALLNDGNACSAPVRVSGALNHAVASGDKVSDINSILVTLEANKDYALTFKNPNMTGTAALAFNPSISVVSKEQWDAAITEATSDDENLKTPVMPEGISLDVVDNGPSLIRPAVTYLVAPEAAGDYVIIIKNTPVEDAAISTDASIAADDQSIADDYCFELYENGKRDGQFIRFSASDGSRGFNYTQEEIMELRRALSPYVSSLNSDNEPAAFSEGAEAAFNEKLEQLNATHNLGLGELSGGMMPLDSDMLIPWDEALIGARSLGGGFDALTGGPSGSVTGVKPFTIKEDVGNSRVQNYSYTFLQSAADMEKSLEINAKAKYNGSVVKATAEGSYANSIKISDTSTTLYLTYTYLDTEPRKLQPDQYSLTNEAAETLKKEAKSDINKARANFRAKYGDYFIAGAVYGGSYRAFLSIKTKDTKSLETIKAKLVVSGGKGEISAEAKRQIKNALKESQVTITREMKGYSPSTALDDSSQPVTVDELLDELTKFTEATKKSDFKPVKLRAYMLSYSQIPIAKRFIQAAADGVTPQDFAEMSKLARTYLAYRARITGIKDWRAIDFSDNGKYQREVLAEADGLAAEMHQKSTALLKDANGRKEFQTKMEATLKRISDMCDWHEFYLDIQAVMRNIYFNMPQRAHGREIKNGQGNADFGYYNYGKSPIVNKAYFPNEVAVQPSKLEKRTGSNEWAEFEQNYSTSSSWGGGSGKKTVFSWLWLRTDSDYSNDGHIRVGNVDGHMGGLGFTSTADYADSLCGYHSGNSWYPHSYERKHRVVNIPDDVYNMFNWYAYTTK